MEDKQQNKKKNNIFIGIFIQGQERSDLRNLLNFKKELAKHGSPLCPEYGGINGSAISCYVHEVMAKRIEIVCG